MSEKPFWFHDVWINQEGFDHLVAMSWNSGVAGMTMYQVNKKLKVVKIGAMSWLKKQNSLKTQINVVHEDLAAMTKELGVEPSSIALQRKLQGIKDDLVAMRDRSIEELQQILRIKWLRLGDSNSTIFSRMTKDQPLQNSLMCNLDASGNLLTTRIQLEEDSINYFF